MLKYLFLALGLGVFSCIASADNLLADETLTTHDAVLVVDAKGREVVSWGAERALIPASVTKLVTAYLALDKWGSEHRFYTDFYLADDCLWVKGYGDPMLISEELDRIAIELNKRLTQPITELCLDNHYFMQQRVPGRGASNDPYNAPLSALSANFNTAKVLRSGGQLQSAEPQTPLTPLVTELVAKQALTQPRIGSKPQRINLQSRANAERYFGELLALKLGANTAKLNVGGHLPTAANLLYRHHNTHTLAAVLRGTLEYSNNFIANQLFVLLGKQGDTSAGLQSARSYAAERLSNDFGWSRVKLVEGAGLSRQNRLTAQQVLQVLRRLTPHQQLLKKYSLALPRGAAALAYAKSGTLDGVHTFAGYLQVAQQDYLFVLLFNRPMPYRYRETLLQKIAHRLPQQPANAQ